MSEGAFVRATRAVRPVDVLASAEAEALQAQLTKPPGSLGRLEDLAVRLAAIYRRVPLPLPSPVTIAVFAADHGVVAEGVSAWPQEVTAQMVANFAAGGAAINVIARQIDADVIVVDVGVAGPIPGGGAGVRDRRVRAGSRNLAVGAAMTRGEAAAALDVGAEIAAEVAAGGSRLLVTGDMGIGNTTASAAVIAAITRTRPAPGPGAGSSQHIVARKADVIAKALARMPADAGPLTVLAEVGGLEIAALAGYIVGGAAAGVPVVVDGVIAAAAALVAVEHVPAATGYVIAGHLSAEPAAAAAMHHLGLTPLLDLGLRLGEGTGAALAVPLVQAAARLLGEMATFGSAGVSSGGGP
jgi:nicotinate-nucleotide--dimethylbenzimidazole phosphoribosyltransferase